MTETEADVLSYYARHYRSGMVDLSSSCPSPQDALGETTIPLADLAYSGPGTDRGLRAAIAARYESLGPDHVVVTNGASEALAALALVLAAPGVTVYSEPGAYPTFATIAARTGAAPTHDWRRADIAVYANPGVPCGQPLELPAILAARAGRPTIVDEVYRELTLTGRRASAAADLSTDAVSVGDLSKPLGLAGLRIGWVASRDGALIERVAGTVALASGGPAAPSIALAERAFARFDATVAAVRRQARISATTTYAVLERFGWAYRTAMSGLTVLAAPPRPLDEESLTCLRTQGFFLVPADVFGFPGAFRVSLLQPSALAAALQSISATHARRPDSVIILTKDPDSGTAKTRLAAVIGNERAAALAHAFLTDTLAMARSTGHDGVVSVAGEPTAMRSLATSADVFAQPLGDLGQRIAHALRRQLRLGQRAVLIGSDTPDLPSEIIAQAFAALDSSPVVLGPAVDGGFYLIGARWSDPRLFDDVEWSTSSVRERVVLNARRLYGDVAILPEWQDVDDASSLAALERRIAGGARCDATRAALATPEYVHVR